jgi:hypothetical protein
MVAGGEMESSGRGRSRRGSMATAAMEDSGGLHGAGDRRLESAGDGSDSEDERATSHQTSVRAGLPAAGHHSCCQNCRRFPDY